VRIAFASRIAIILLLLWSVNVFAQETERFDKAYCVKCHKTQVEGISRTPHGNTLDERTPFAQEQCESCHGDSSRHLEFSTVDKAELGGMVTFKKNDGNDPKAKDNNCLQCHQGGNRIHWQGGAHDSNDVTCSDCHKVHTRDHTLVKGTQAQACFNCHKDVNMDFLRPSAHPANEKINCSDCHEPHGSAGPKSLKRLETNQVCYDCHAEKRGPYLWEHAPASEDCVSCHRPHGSNHTALLKTRPPFLCQQCHINESGTQHVRRVMEYPASGGDRARFIVGSSCMNCHPKIHGSNHPSGVSLTR
jgi:DmsE family decaheme c-type cytochrome